MLYCLSVQGRQTKNSYAQKINGDHGNETVHATETSNHVSGVVLSRELRVGFPRKPGADKWTKAGKLNLRRGRGAPLEVPGTRRGTPAMQWGTPALPPAPPAPRAGLIHNTPASTQACPLPETRPHPRPPGKQGLVLRVSAHTHLLCEAPLSPPLSSILFSVLPKHSGQPSQSITMLDFSSCRSFHGISLLDSFRDCV